MTTKTTFYWLWTAIALLLVLNLGIIGWITRERATPPVGGSDRLAHAERLPVRLGFTPRQTTDYRLSQQQLLTELQVHEDTLRQLRSTLFGQPDRLSDAESNRLIGRMEQQQGRMLRLRLDDWQRLRAICTPAQRTQFDSILARLGERISQPTRWRDRLNGVTN